MARDNNEYFWDTDVTTMHDRRSWFGRLSPLRKIVYVLLLLFVVEWAFLLGFSAVGATMPGEDEYFFVSGDDINEEMIAPTVELEGTKVILLVGCDAREGEDQARSDTIMLAFLDMDDHTVSLLSIPRDTYVQIAGTSTKTKINHAFYYGGVSMTKSTVEQLTGLTIDNYAIIDFKGFAAVVDAIGGVEVDVDQRMYKPSEDIDLQPGVQVLDGYNALAYVRFRDYPDGDLGRVAHQQNFIKLLTDKMFSAETVTKIPELVKIAFNNVETDLTTKECLEMASYAVRSDMNEIKTYTVPGEGKWLMEYSSWLSYQIIIEDEFLEMLNEITGGDLDFTPNITTDGGMGRYSIPEDVEEPGEHADEEQPDIDPELLNDPNFYNDPENWVDPNTYQQPVVDPNVPDPNAQTPTVPDPAVPDPNAQTPYVPDPNVPDPNAQTPTVPDPNAGGIDQNTDVWDLPEPE